MRKRELLETAVNHIDLAADGLSEVPELGALSWKLARLRDEVKVELAKCPSDDAEGQ